MGTEEKKQTENARTPADAKLETKIRRAYSRFNLDDCRYEYEDDGLLGVVRYMVEEVCETSPVIFPLKEESDGVVTIGVAVRSESIAGRRGDRLARCLELISEYFGLKNSRGRARHMNDGVVFIGIGYDTDDGTNGVESGKDGLDDGEDVEIHKVDEKNVKRDSRGRFVKGGDEETEPKGKDGDDEICVLKFTGKDVELARRLVNIFKRAGMVEDEEVEFRSVRGRHLDKDFGLRDIIREALSAFGADRF